MKALLGFILCLCFSFVGFGQAVLEDSLFRVLLIPFGLYEMHTEFTLPELNGYNGMEKDQFYPAVLKEFTSAFETHHGDNVVFKTIDSEDWKNFKFIVNFTYIQKKAHYSCDIQPYNLNDYNDLLDKYNCEYLLVVPWYKISKSKTTVVEGKSRKMGPYSSHLIDYDFFNRKKEKLHYEAMKTFEATPTSESLKTRGLLIKQLGPAFGKLSEDISKEILEVLAD